MGDTLPDVGDDGLLAVPERRDAFPADVVEAVDDLPLEDRKVGTRRPISLTEAMAELAAISLVDVSLHEVMRRIAALAQAVVPGADEVSVTFLDGPRTSTVAFTGDLAVQLDERQYADGFGPCMDAARNGGTIRMFDLSTETRYPDFVAAALRVGVTGTLSIGMPLPSHVVGGLNIYGRGGDAHGTRLGEASVPDAEAFAQSAAIALANAGLLHSTQRFADQMQEAMASRAVIEQAKGVIVARTGCTADEAFAELARQSRTSGRKLALIAAEILASAQREGPGSRGSGDDPRSAG